MKPLTDYVCTLEQAKELKRLGVKQDSIHWYAIKPIKDYVIYVGDLLTYKELISEAGCPEGDGFSPDMFSGNCFVSAFTSGELGVMLDLHKKTAMADVFSEIRNLDLIEFPYEAKARAEILIRRLKKGTEKLEEVNKRLE